MTPTLNNRDTRAALRLLGRLANPTGDWRDDEAKRLAKRLLKKLEKQRKK